MKTKVLKIVLFTVVASLGVLFVGDRLYKKTRKIDVALHHNITGTITQLKAVDARWNEDVLKSRLRLNQDYDPLVTAKVTQADLENDLIEALSAITESDVQVLPRLSAYQEIIKAKIDLAEEFKGENAIFRNSAVFIPFSLRSFSGMVKEVKVQSGAPVSLLSDLEYRIQTLSVGFLEYTTQLQDQTMTFNAQLIEELKELSQDQRLPRTIHTDLTIILNHVDMVLRKKPVVDEIITTIISMPTATSLDQVRTAYDQLYEQHLADSNTSQTLFVAYLACLAIVSSYIALRLLNKRRIRLLTTVNEALEKRVELSQELERTHEKLKRSQMQLIQSEKMSALGQMVAGVAHEINTPLAYSRSNVAHVHEQLASVVTLVEAASKQTNLIKLNDLEDENTTQNDHFNTVSELAKSLQEDGIVLEMEELLQASVSGLDQIAEMVLNLKDFSRLDRKKIDKVNLNDGLDSSLMIAKNTLKHKVQVIKEYDDIPVVACAPSQINQVFLNILVNAAHAIADEGTITLTTRAIGDQVEVMIKDDGPGIPEEVLPHIFDPFFTTKDVGEGTGLGLAISHQIIEQHGGTLSVQSKVGNGTCFTISLPVVAQISASGSEDWAPSPVA